MSSVKGDFGRGLIVIGPVLVTLFILYTLYAFISSITPGIILNADLLEPFFPWLGDYALAQLASLLRVLSFVCAIALAMYVVGQLTDTTTGDVFEGIADYVANRVPVIRVIYNASKTATETALGEGQTLQTPVHVETWDGLRMTAFKTGRTTQDGRVTLFLPTSPNITTGFVLEVSTDEITELDESVEEALTRVVSAGFGDADRAEDLEDGSLTVVGEIDSGGPPRR
ncbi:DUF502 domain-containing protein [Natronolimnohabitans innermongolicus]|uniref:DUF502 domain-containing protein n=1 Tax=Natronolimnohabitans innermongolicus JCM 12255 TaxID=1227499 RepID=L9XGF7_9EURY|nr:DUF502 domain-containing protein [Natronolimnohabitans innermongolicus]ELY60805.1 hypothetical protein C493_03847 [Natronolimnohabitans innermongolicus JCM 12255]